jgi:hypothetical protein
MTRTIVRFAALIGLLIGTASPATSAVAFTLRGITLAVNSVSMTQRVGSGGQTIHDISVSFGYGPALSILESMAEYLRNNGVPPDPMSITITTSNNGTVTDVRTFGVTIVKEISLPSMDARSKEALTMQMKFEASTLQMGAAGGAAPKPSATKYKSIAASQFVASVETLPSAKIIRINSHRMLPCAQGGCDSLNAYELMLRGADVATWRSWFTKASADPAYTVEGSYTVTAADLSTPIMKMKLMTMKPVSFIEGADEIGPTARVLFQVPSVRPNVN